MRAMILGILRNMSLRRQFTVTILALSLVMLALFGVVRIGSMIEHNREELQVKANALTKLAAIGFSDPLWNYHYEGMAAIGSALLQDKEVARVMVRGEDGSAVFDSLKQAVPYEAEYLLTVSAPVERNGDKLGTVSIVLTQFYRNEEIREEAWGMVAGIIVIGGILWVMIAGISLMVTRPLDELSAGAEEIAHGNFDKRITLRAGGEVGELAAKFNSMADNLRHMMQALEHANLDLADKNRSLEAEISERKQARFALAASEEKFYKAFRYSADVIGIMRLDDGCCMEMSDAFFRMFGFGRKEVIGHSAYEGGWWEPEGAGRTLYLELRAAGSLHNRETVWRTRSGEQRVGVYSAETIAISGENCAIFLWHDITERKQAEQALQLAHDELEMKVEIRTRELTALNEELTAMNSDLESTLSELTRMQDQLVQSQKMAALGNLVAGVAHEINTPVGIGVTLASHIEQICLDFHKLYDQNKAKRQDLTNFIEDCNEASHLLLSNLQRAARLISSFKQVSVDQSFEGRRVFQVGQYLDEILLSLQPRLKKTKQSVQVLCDAQLEVESFPGFFYQIVTNLVVNALVHAYEPDTPGTITIEARRRDDRLRLVITDDGKGMEPQVLDKIFEPFFTTKRGAGGTGLGMFIVYNLVTQQLGGTLECRSHPGQGTGFFIEFPCKWPSAFGTRPTTG